MPLVLMCLRLLQTVGRARAVFDFDATEENELSVRSGEVLTILDDRCVLLLLLLLFLLLYCLAMTGIMTAIVIVDVVVSA